MTRKEVLKAAVEMAESIGEAIPERLDREVYRAGFIRGYMYHYDLVNKKITELDTSNDLILNSRNEERRI